VSSPGATPIATQTNGVVVYLYNTNNNENNNGQNINNSNAQGGGGLSGGAIGGIATACTVISTILAAMGIWYARKQARRKQSKSTVQIENGSQSSARFSSPPATQGYTQPASPVNAPYELPWNEVYPNQPGLDSHPSVAADLHR